MVQCEKFKIQTAGELIILLSIDLKQQSVLWEDNFNVNLACTQRNDGLYQWHTFHPV